MNKLKIINIDRGGMETVGVKTKYFKASKNPLNNWWLIEEARTRPQDNYYVKTFAQVKKIYKQMGAK